MTQDVMGAAAVIVTDPEGRVTFLNPVARTMSGWTQQDALGRPAATACVILNGRTRQPIDNLLEKVRREGICVDLGNRAILIGKGIERSITGSISPIPGCDGTLLGMVLVFRGVTEPPAATRLSQSEGRNSAILQTALDCIIMMDHRGNVLEFNPASETTFGYRRGDVIGRDLADLIIPPPQRDAHRKGLARYLETGEGPAIGNRLELTALRADGSEFPVELAITRVPADGPPLFTAYLRDISDRIRTEQLRSVRFAVTQHLTQATDIGEAASGVLRAVCENLHWDLGIFWAVDDEADTLECIGRWHRADLQVERFADASCSRPFRKGEGLPGRVWSSGRSAWILELVDDANFPRGAAAAREGLRSAFACPIVVGDRTVGVIEFFTTRLREPDPELLETMATVAAHVGQFVERRQAEEKLRRSERELADFFENATIGLHWVGPDGTILQANRAELELLGYSAEEYVGRNIAEFHADAETICDILQRLQAREKLHDYPARMRCKDGSIRDVLIHSSVLSEGGRFIHTRCFTRDITDSKRAEDALRESEEKLRLLADTIPQLAWMAHSDGSIFWYNRRWYEYTGTTPGEMEGWGWQSVHAPDVLPEVRERWMRSIASGEPFEMVFPLRGADQLFRPFLTRVNPLRDAQGRIVYWFGTNTDISDIKRMEEALRDADRRKDEFLATLAHELRNPLAPISNSLQILKMPRLDAAIAQQARDMMERQIHHLGRLVDDLLDVSRVMQGKIELRREPVELATVAARAVETAQPIIDAQAHRLDISIPDESLLVHGDPVRLAQVVGNLLTNAAKYTEANGHIAVWAGRENGEAVLRVRDDGIGMAPDMLPHVFELFVQADHAATRSQGGLGIGLTLVKNLVEMHGGTVEGRSAGLGKGSEFTIRLPLLTRKRDRLPVFSDTQAAPSPGGHRLMVVDDNKDAAESLAALLRLKGNDVRVAYDGASAIEVARAYRPALIFLDIGMPGMDGFEAVRRMRRTPGLENTIIAALTGWGQEDDRRRTAEAGFDHHLVKPPQAKALEDLLAVLSRIFTPARGGGGAA